MEVAGEDTGPDKKPEMIKITGKFGVFHNFRKVGDPKSSSGLTVSSAFQLPILGSF